MGPGSTCVLSKYWPYTICSTDDDDDDEVHYTAPRKTSAMLNQTSPKQQQQHMDHLVQHDIIFTFSLHAHVEALHVAAILTTVALPLVNQTALVIPACVREIFTHCTFEEALATLTAVNESGPLENATY